MSPYEKGCVACSDNSSVDVGAKERIEVKATHHFWAAEIGRTSLTAS